MALDEKFIAQLISQLAGHNQVTQSTLDQLPPGTRTAIKAWLGGINVPEVNDEGDPGSITTVHMPESGFSDLTIAYYSGDDPEVYRITGVFYKDKILAQSLDVSS